MCNFFEPERGFGEAEEGIDAGRNGGERERESRLPLHSKW